MSALLQVARCSTSWCTFPGAHFPIWCDGTSWRQALSPVYLVGCKRDWMSSKSNMVAARGFLHQHLLGSVMKVVISYMWVYACAHMCACPHASINIAFIHIECNGLCTVWNTGSERKGFAWFCSCWACCMNMEEKSFYYLFITANIPVFPSLLFRALSSSLLGCFIAILISA